MRNLLILAGLSMLMAVGACAFTPKATRASSQTLGGPTGPVSPSNQIGKDLSKYLKDAEPLWTNYNNQGTLPPLNWNLAYSGNGFDFLTHEQKLQLGGWVTPSGKKVDLTKWYAYVQQYEAANGILPSNGQEVIDWILGKYSDDQRPDLAKLSFEELPIWYYAMVNPQTGELYQSFNGSTPEPGGIKIHELTDKQDALRAFNGRPGADAWDRPGYIGGYEFIVSSEDPQKVLDTAVVLLHNDVAASSK